MSVRTWMAGVTVALVAVLGARGRRGRLGRTRQEGRRRSRWPSSPTSAASTTRASTRLAYKGLKVAQRSRHPGARVHLEERRGLHPEPLDCRASGLRPRGRGRLPHGRLDRRRREEVPEDEVRDHRLLGGGLEGQAEERCAASCSRSRRRATSPASLRRRPRSRDRSRSVGGQTVPAVDRLHRRLQGGCAKKVKPEAQGAVTGTRRTSSTRTSARRSR